MHHATTRMVKNCYQQQAAEKCTYRLSQIWNQWKQLSRRQTMTNFRHPPNSEYGLYAMLTLNVFLSCMGQFPVRNKLKVHDIRHSTLLLRATDSVAMKAIMAATSLCAVSRKRTNNYTDARHGAMRWQHVTRRQKPQLSTALWYAKFSSCVPSKHARHWRHFGYLISLTHFLTLYCQRKPLVTFGSNVNSINSRAEMQFDAFWPLSRN